MRLGRLTVMDVIETSIICHSRDRVFQPNAAEKITAALEMLGDMSNYDFVEVASRLLDEHTIYFGDDGPSPYMHLVLMGEEVVK